MDNSNDKNHREFTRVPVHIKVDVTAGGQVFTADETHDLSMKGVCVSGADLLPSGTECLVSLKLVGSETPIHIDVKGVVGRSGESDMVIEFVEIDLESYDHLQNLVKYNSHDSGQVERELKGHLGLKRREE